MAQQAGWRVAVGVLLSLVAGGAFVSAAQPVRVTSYEGTVWGVAVGVEADGRAHVLWTGKRSADVAFTAFYASSTDGVGWPSYQVLDTGEAFDPSIAVDDAHGRVHLVYRSNTNGIIHRTVTGGVVSAPTTVDLTGVTRPVLTVNPVSGFAYLTWLKWDAGFTTQYGMFSWWNGTSWSSPVEPVVGALWNSIAVSPSGAVMLGGRRELSSNYHIARSAVAADGVSFAAPVQVADGYGGFEEDSSAVVVYSHGDGSFHLAANHFIESGSSETHHWVWSGSAWSGPDNLSQSAAATFSAREQLGSVPALSYLVVSWMEFTAPETLWARTWSGGTTTPAEDIGAHLTDAGVRLDFNGTYATCLATDGSLHLALGEAAYEELGVYYLALPRLDTIFADGFESGATSAWSFNQS